MKRKVCFDGCRDVYRTTKMYRRRRKYVDGFVARSKIARVWGGRGVKEQVPDALKNSFRWNFAWRAISYRPVSDWLRRDTDCGSCLKTVREASLRE